MNALLPSFADLTLAIDAAKRGSDGIPKHAQEVMGTNYHRKIEELMDRGVIRIQFGHFVVNKRLYTFKLTYHTQMLQGTRDYYTLGDFDDRTQWNLIRQTMQQPPFYFTYNGVERAWFSMVPNQEVWVHAAISRRYDYIENKLFEYIQKWEPTFAGATGTRQDPMKIIVTDGDYYLIFPSGYLNNREELGRLIQDEPYLFTRVTTDEKADRGLPMHTKIFKRIPMTDTPLGPGFLNAVAVHQQQLAVEEEKIRRAAEERERAEALRRQLDQEAWLNRKRQMEQDEARRQQRIADHKRRDELHRALVEDGTIPDEDKQWYRETFKESVEAGVERAVLSEYDATSKDVASRGGGEKRKIPLKYYRMVPFANAVWSLVGDIQDQIVEKYEEMGMNPVIGALPGGKTIKVKTRLFLPIPSDSVTIFVRTVPSAAKAHMETRPNNVPSDEYAAITWSLTFDQDTVERDVINSALTKPRNEGGPGYALASDGAQVLVRSSASLNAALNALWESDAIFTEQDRRNAHTWDETIRVQETTEANIADAA